ncbi:acetyl-CoA acetyltransferase [Helicobacter sp. 16-1353]|uniref:acetyl-CoA C-acetyltransferase n=1 Tax=Helicobacter sp. 16-1353 TaxID=2004996 RepID=UPI000DCEAEF1|nr:acetyl-CoA C-acetyltransferase [Helicobacter sp. 16-1353]RAX52060.1 acetyl-CoA acetyltransferase [Helicobacter sp. 16-1353]
MCREVVVVAAKRTAIGSFLGSLKSTSPRDLASSVAKAIIKDTNLDVNLVDELILGQILQSSQGQNVARQVAIYSGIPQEKGAYTINKLCGSGLKSVQLAFNEIALGNSDVIFAGGVENMSLSPFTLENIRGGYKMGDQKVVDTMIKDGLTDAFSGVHMGITAENLAKKYNVSREEQDAFALDSQQKASKARKAGKFKDEIVPVMLKSKKGETAFDTDEFIKDDISLESLAKLRPAFDKEGTVTAGNASGVNDGAAMILLMSKDKAKKLGLPILAKIKAIRSVGVDPSIMGIGAAMAAKKVLKDTNLKVDNIDLIEANEAFAAQSLACIKEFNPPLDRLNVNGGAIALGHPIGASGARVVVTLLYEMIKRDSKLGLATLCIGGGQGIAGIFERE